MDELRGRVAELEEDNASLEQRVKGADKRIAAAAAVQVCHPKRMVD